METAIAKPQVLKSGSWNAQKRLGQTLLYLFLGGVGIFILFPFYYMIISSFRAPFYNFDQLVLELFPTGFHFDSYIAIFTKKIGFETSIIALSRGLANTMILEIAIVGVSTVLNALAAYTFAKRTFPGKQFLFTLLLVTIILPGEVTLVTKYVMFHDWHLLNTLWALILPSLTSIFGIFLMRQFISTIPDALLEAARLDGANELQVVLQVVFPLSLPVMATYALFTFLGVWNDLIGPLIFNSSDPNHWTLQLALYNQFSALAFQYGSAYGDATGLRMQTLFAGLILSALPTIVVFVLFQRQLISGITLTGLKG